jgi:hypothetical protein
MDRQLKEWKWSIERLLSAAVPDYGKALLLAGDIARLGEEPTLRQAATQALPILRSASLDGADRATELAARRRLIIIGDALHDLIAPKFGKRGNDLMLTPEEHYRQMLGLPLGCRLSGVQIHQAFKRAAKTAHPDGGGSAPAFLELSAARDALMKQR